MNGRRGAADDAVAGLLALVFLVGIVGLGIFEAMLCHGHLGMGWCTGCNGFTIGFMSTVQQSDGTSIRLCSDHYGKYAIIKAAGGRAQ